MVRTARSVAYRVCLLLLFHSVLLHADVIPGRWEKVEAQAPITQLIFCNLPEKQVSPLWSNRPS